jgi:hypothetical protein
MPKVAAMAMPVVFKTVIEQDSSGSKKKAMSDMRHSHLTVAKSQTIIHMTSSSPPPPLLDQNVRTSMLDFNATVMAKVGKAIAVRAVLNQVQWTE